MCRQTAKCSGCERVFDVTNMVGTVSRKRGNRVEYMCKECNERNLRYHAENAKVLGTAKKNAVFCGIEFESSFSDDYARNAIFEYGFIPTHDASLNSDEYSSRYGYDGSTCEYVSALMKGLNRASKFCLTCDYLIENGHLKVNNSCGTHFHVSINSMKDASGNNTGRNSYMDMIRRFYNSLFTPLTNEMLADVNKTKRVFGRTFNGYAEAINEYSNPSNRYFWINVKADNNIEFRLNRFTSGKQYQNLMKMEVKMVQTIVTNFCEHFMDDDFDRSRYENRTAYRKHKASVTAQKLVKIYNEFAENI